MMRRFTLVALRLLLVLLTPVESFGEAIQEDTAKGIVDLLYPGVPVVFGGPDGLETKGNIQLTAEKSFPFSLRRINGNATSVDWDVYLFKVEPGAFDDSALTAFLHGGPLPAKSVVRDAIVTVSLVDGKPISSYLPDMDAIFSTVENTRLGDLINDGTTQLRISALSMHAAEHPNEIASVGSERILRLPEFTELFAGISFRTITTSEFKKVWEVAPTEFRLVRPKTGSVLDIEQVLSRDNKIRSRYVYDGKRYNYTIPISNRDPVAAEHRLVQQQSLGKERTLRLRVVDDDGEPIPDALISGVWRLGDEWINPESMKVVTFDGRTDENGRFAQSTSGRISVSISKVGFYDVMRNWNYDDLPSEEVKIALEAAPTDVPLFRWVVGGAWKEHRDVFEFGAVIARAEGAKKRVDRVTDDRSSSDLWMRVELSSEMKSAQSGGRVADGSRKWRIRIAAQNGWTLAPGPTGRVEEFDPRMAVAPETGYSTELMFDSTDHNAVFFRHEPSGRFGKAYQLTFSDKSFQGTPKYNFEAWGWIQAKANGSTSLMPNLDAEDRAIYRATTGRDRPNGAGKTQLNNTSSQQPEPKTHVDVAGVSQTPQPKINLSSPPTDRATVARPLQDASQTPTPSSQAGKQEVSWWIPPWWFGVFVAMTLPVMAFAILLVALRQRRLIDVDKKKTGT